MNLPLRRSLALALLLALVAPAARAQQPRATFTAEPTVAPSDDGLWPIALQLRNVTPAGLYLDSLAVTITPAAGAATRRALSTALAVRSLGDGDSTAFTITLPASRESARLHFELWVHAQAAGAYTLDATVEARSFDLLAIHPERHVRAGGREVVLRAVAADAPSGLGLLYLPEPGADPLAVVTLAHRLARGGTTVEIVSPPASDDFAGPASLAGAALGLDSLLRMPGVATGRIAAWGVGSGGTLALLLAERRGEVHAVIAQSAHVDPWASARLLSAAARPAFVAAAGRDSAAWRARAPLAGLGKLAAPVLLLHGERDDVAPADAAHGLAALLHESSRVAETRFYPAAGHALPADDVSRLVRRFLAAQLPEAH